MTDWRRNLTGPDSFFPVLALTVVSVIMSPLVDSFRWGFLLMFPLLAATVLMSLHRSGVGARVLRAAIALLVIVGVGTIVTTYARHAGFGDERLLVAVTSFLFAALYLLAIPAVTRRAFQHTRVSFNTLAAGITAYLFIGLLFTMLFRGASALADWHAFVGISTPSSGDYSYFSFETLTTLGYGDLAPRTHAMRTLAIFEAIIGQIFLVTAVARIVSLLGQQQDRVPIDAGHPTPPVHDPGASPTDPD